MGEGNAPKGLFLLCPDGWKDGRMCRSEAMTQYRSEAMTQYICVFKPGQECPVRKEYKLQPENLLEYCKICYINPINKQEAKIDMEMLSEHLPRFMDMYIKMRKEEKDQLLDIIKTLADSRRE